MGKEAKELRDLHEEEEKKMSEYTKEEIGELFKTLEFLVIETIGNSIYRRVVPYEDFKGNLEDKEYYTIIHVFNTEFSIKGWVLFNIIKYVQVVEKLYNDNEGNTEFLKEYMWINNVLHYESIGKMPLYINSLPEIASWRLKINK
jgi:hypothetical protein